MITVELKPCTKADVNVAVPLIYASGPDSFDFVFKNHKHSAQDFLKFAFLRNGGEFSYDNHYALWRAGEIVAVGSYFKHKKASSFTFADAKNIIIFFGLRGIGVALNGLKVETLIKLPKKNEITLGHLGVVENIRGQGFGTQLIVLLMQKAKKQANEYFVLDVSEENPKAKALYEKLGFKVSRHYLSNFRNKFSYVPNHFRMELKGCK